MKNIVLMVDSLVGGGAEISNLRLANAFVKKGYNVHLIIMKDVIDFDINKKIIFYSLHYKKKYINIINNLYYAYKLKSILKNIEINFGEINLILGSLGLTHKLMNIIHSDKYHYVLHGTTTKAKLGNRTGIKRLIKLFHIKNLYNHKKLICVSEGIKNDILNTNITPILIKKIYNIFDFEKIKELSKETIDIELPNSYIIHVGRFSKVKRHDILIKAFNLLDDKNLKLILLGDGEERDNIIKLINNLNLSNRIILVGFKKNPYPYIENAKALILSSDHEGLPTVLIESLILNTLPISTSCPGSKEILSPELANCISKIGNFNDLALVINKNLDNETTVPTILLKKFNENKIIKEYEELF